MKSNRLKDKLAVANVFLDLPAGDCYDLIRTVSQLMREREEVVDADRMAQAAIERETELSTGIDRGVAMPHARTNAVNALVCAFIRPHQPVDFGSADGAPCDLIFFSAVPNKCVDQYLHFTAGIVRKLQHDDVLSRLRSAREPGEVLTVLGV